MNNRINQTHFEIYETETDPYECRSILKVTESSDNNCLHIYINHYYPSDHEDVLANFEITKSEFVKMFNLFMRTNLG